MSSLHVCLAPKNLSDDKFHDVAVYNIREMPRDIAWTFMTDIHSLSVYNVVFGDDNFVKDLRNLHILQDYDMEIPEDQTVLTLFVATPNACAVAFDYIYRYTSEEGYILEAKPNSQLPFKFHEKSLRKRFSCGLAKLITSDDFLRTFVCKCEDKGNTVCRTGMASAQMTVFLEDTLRYPSREMAEKHRPSVLYRLLQIYPRLSGIRAGHRADVPQKRRKKGCERDSNKLISGCALPPLVPHGRTRRLPSWDKRCLYHWSYA